MKKYEYVTIDTLNGFFSNQNQNYREVIDTYAAKGYRYVGWFPVKTSNLIEGAFEKVDLIFEIDE